MKFTKYNNPNRRRSVRRPAHSEAYVKEMQEKRDALLAQCKTGADKEYILKAYDVSMNP